MAKRKRTREQKKLADHRRDIPPKADNSAIEEVQNEPVSSPKYTFSFQSTPSIQPQTKAVTTATSTAIIQKDLRKTAILTASIVIAQVILYIIVNSL